MRFISHLNDNKTDANGNKRELAPHLKPTDSQRQSDSESIKEELCLVP